jgi:flavin-dependent dehydrogenase
MAGMACVRTLLRDGIRPLMAAPPAEVVNRGETLSFRAAASLDHLGWRELLDEEVALRSQGRYSIWGGGALRRDGMHEEAAGWHLDRAKLEARMAASLDAASVARIAAPAIEILRAPAHVTVVLGDGSTIPADVVIDCTGRAAVTADANASLRRLDRLVACYAHFSVDNAIETVAATLVEAVAEGWWYASMLPDRRMLVGLFTDSDLLPSGLRKDAGLWAQMVARTTAVSARLESLDIDVAAADLQFASASTVTASRLTEPRILRAGDAASALDPLGANGLATALWSGIQAARSAASLLRGDAAPAARYEQQFLQGILAHLASQAALYASERRFVTAPFWQRRQGEAGHSASGAKLTGRDADARSPAPDL